MNYIASPPFQGRENCNPSPTHFTIEFENTILILLGPFQWIGFSLALGSEREREPGHMRENRVWGTTSYWKSDTANASGSQFLFKLLFCVCASLSTPASSRLGRSSLEKRFWLSPSPGLYIDIHVYIPLTSPLSNPLKIKPVFGNQGCERERKPPQTWSIVSLFPTCIRYE